MTMLKAKLQNVATSLRTRTALDVSGPGAKYAEWFQYLFIAGTAMKKALQEQDTNLPSTVKEWLKMMIGEFEGLIQMIDQNYKREAFRTACKKTNDKATVEGKLIDFRNRLAIDAEKASGGEKYLLASLAFDIERLRQNIISV